MPTPLAATLFDMDGTLVDTEALWVAAVHDVAAANGHSVTDADAPHILGRPVEHTAAHLHRATGAPETALAAALHREFADRVRAGGIVPLPGAVELLDALRAERIPVALVSASPRAIVDLVLDALGRDRFAVSMTADDTERTKPHPDPYLAAARALNVAPEHCVAVEDTVTGVASAEAAGCRVLAVPSLSPVEPRPGRTILDSLTQADPTLLAAMVEAMAGATVEADEGRGRLHFLVPAFRAPGPDTTVSGLLRNAEGPVTYTHSGGAPGIRVLPDGTLTGSTARADHVHVTAEDARGHRARITVRIPAPGPPATLRVMSWNLWLGGTQVDAGRDKQLRVLLESDVDAVGLQEAGPQAVKELAEALGWEGHHAGDTVAVLSRHPITERYEGTATGPETRGTCPGAAQYGGTGARIQLAPGQALVLWSTHLHCAPYGPYEDHFDGLPAPVLVQHEYDSGRVDQLDDVLAAMAPQLAECDRTPVLLTGDFNAPSHLDSPDVRWPVTLAAEAAGLRDSYREAHPDPATDPGVTWSPVHTLHEDGSGRPEPQDRIDYVLYAGDRLAVRSAETLVTGGTLRDWPDVRGNDWPSDHAAVVTTFTF